MSTISGRHLKEPSTSTYVRHLQVFWIDIDIFWSQSLIFCTLSCENAWKISLCVCVCTYTYISTYDCAFYDSGFWGFFSVINQYIFNISIDICREPCWHSTSTFADIWIDICAPPYPHPSPKRARLWGVIGTAQVGASLVVPLEFIFKRSRLCSSRNMIMISWYIHFHWWYASARCSTSQVRPDTHRIYTCMRLFYFLSLLNLWGSCVSISHDSGKVDLPTAFFGCHCLVEPTSLKILPMVLAWYCSCS